jgi:hypothetical protein
MNQMINVIEGEILVNSVWKLLETESLILFEIDCKSKYPKVGCYSSTGFSLYADDTTLHTGPEGEDTVIDLKLPEHYSIDAIKAGRYDVRVYCVNDRLMKSKQQKPKMIWETERK